MKKEITWFGRKVILACDEKCNKAWGINCRPENPANYLSDDELEEAPIDPGTYEGGHAKPCPGEEKGN